MRKYDESCERMDAKSEPFMVESHGFLAAGAVQLLDQLAGCGAEVLCMTFCELEGHFKRRLAIAVQRGNVTLIWTLMAFKPVATPMGQPWLGA